MKPGTLVVAFATVLFTAAGLSAQDAVPTDDSEPSESSIFTTTPSRISAAFSGPFRPVLKGVASGGGIGAGGRYDLPAFGPWQTTTTAIVTMHRYWSLQFDTAYESDRTETVAYARMRDMSRLNFFGVGSNSDVGDRTTFQLRDPIIGAVAAVRVIPSVSVGGRVEALWPSVGRGRSSRFPSIDERFGEPVAPGLSAQPRLGRYQMFLDAAVPAAVGEALHQGAKYRVAYAIVADHELDRFSFRRLDVEAQQRFAGLAPHHRLTLHGWLSTAYTADGHDVPFFLQPTLGGKGHLRSVHEDLIGSDGTRATLRAFPSFRFRDRNLLLLQAEYRIPVWSLVDATLFVDAGKVSRRPADLNFSDLKRSHGFSLSVMRKAAAVARVDVGFGGGEGTRVLFSVGDFVP